MHASRCVVGMLNKHRLHDACIKSEVPDIRILWSTDERIKNQFESIDSKYSPVSKFPPVLRDISFVVDRHRSLNEFYEIVRDLGRLRGENVVEEVERLDSYENVKAFGVDRVSHTFRITFRSFVSTLENNEINKVQEGIRCAVESELGAVLR